MFTNKCKIKRKSQVKKFSETQNLEEFKDAEILDEQLKIRK